MLFAQCWRSPRWPRASRSWRDSALRTRPISRKFQEGELHGLNITSRHASIIAKLTTQAHHGVLLTPEALQAGVFRLTCPKSPLPPHSQALQVSADFGNLHAYFETFSVWLLRLPCGYRTAAWHKEIRKSTCRECTSHPVCNICQHYPVHVRRVSLLLHPLFCKPLGQ